MSFENARCAWSLRCDRSTRRSVRRHQLTASEWRREMTDRFAVWNEITGLSAAA